MILVTNLVAVLAFIAATAIDQTNAECCYVQEVVNHVCMGYENEMPMPLHKVLQFVDCNEYWLQEEHEVGRPKCYTQLCADGGEVTHFFCGVGDCNIVGCNCDGGCRKGNGTSIQDLKKAWIEQRGFKFERDHRIFG